MGEFFSWLPTFGWILIPVVAILVGGFKEWLKFKEKQTQLGASSDEFVRAIASLRDDRDALTRRVEHLETLLVGQSTPTDVRSAARTAALPEKTGILDADDLFETRKDSSDAVRARGRS